MVRVDVRCPAKPYRVACVRSCDCVAATVDVVAWENEYLYHVSCEIVVILCCRRLEPAATPNRLVVA